MYRHMRSSHGKEPTSEAKRQSYSNRTGNNEYDVEDGQTDEGEWSESEEEFDWDSDSDAFDFDLDEIPPGYLQADFLPHELLDDDVDGDFLPPPVEFDHKTLKQMGFLDSDDERPPKRRRVSSRSAAKSARKKLQEFSDED